MSKKINISNRVAILMAFMAGLVSSAVLSLFFLFSYSKFGLAPTAGVIFIAGAILGSRLMFKSMAKMFDELDADSASDLFANSSIVDICNEILSTVKKYDKDTAIDHIEKIRDEYQEKGQAIFEVENE